MREPTTTVLVTCDVCGRKSADPRETRDWKLIRVPVSKRGYLDTYGSEDWCHRCWESHKQWKIKQKEQG